MIERKKYPISVLIVDDEPTIVQQLSQILGRRVVSLYSASNGEEALLIYQREAVDVIISDIDMPVMNGIELLKAIRTTDPNIPILLSTGLKSLDILIEAIEHGITSFLPKPLKISDIVSKIENIARTKELEQAVKNSNALLEQYKSIVDASIIVSKTDLNGNITYVNDMFCTVSGYTREELIGQPHNIVRDPQMPSGVFAHLWETIQSKKIWHGVVHNRTKEGGQYTVKSTISPIFDEEGNIVEYIGLREDITDLIKKDEILRAERQKLNDILNHIDSIVAMVSVQEKLQFVNEKFFDIFPYRDFYDFKSHHSCICDIFQPAEGLLQQMMGEEYWVEYILNRPNEGHHALMIDQEGNERIFSVKVNRLKTATSELFIVTLNDVTELQRTKEEAKTAAKMKGEFLANMSHEIRTPMNGILGFAALLERTQLNDNQKRYLDIINGSTKTLLGIINDILDFSKLESGKFELDLTPVNPFVEFDKIAQLFSARMEEKRIVFDEIIDPDVSECIQIDLLRIQQIVSNLLSNAIKFTPEGGNVVFYTRLVGNHLDEIIIRIGVKDSGIGISPLQQKKIFEAFSQADSSITRQFGGTGLGLSISSHLVSLMGGKLQVQSVEGEGSDFYFDLTLKTCSSEHSLSSYFQKRNVSLFEGNDPDSVHLQQKVKLYLEQLNVPYRIHPSHSDLSPLQKDDICIVFCDSNADWVQSLIDRNVLILMICNHPETCLSAPKLHVIDNLEHNYSALYNALLNTAKESALQSARTEISDHKWHFLAKVLVAEDNTVNQILIQEYLQQYNLSPVIVENGQEALNELEKETFDLILMDINMPVMSGVDALRRIRERNIRTPVVALTANTMAGDQEKFLAQGFDDYLSKPIVSDQMERVLALFLQKGDGLGIVVPEIAEEFETVPAEQTVPYLDISLIKKELPISDTVIHRLLKAFAESVVGSMEELGNAIARRDFVHIRNSAHYIKGGAGNLRIKLVEELAGSIEEAARIPDERFEYDKTYQTLEQIIVSLQNEIRSVLSEA